MNVGMKKILFRFVLILLVVMASCGKKKPGGSTLTGQLRDAPESMVYFEHISDSGEVYLDSAMTDQDGKFVLENKADALDYYLLRVDAANAVFLVLSGGENVIINGQAKDLEN